MKLLILIIIAFMLISCNSVRDEPTDPIDDLPDAEGFYTVQNGAYLLRYKVIPGQNLECIFRANTNGWLAVGFDPTSSMKNANFIIGYVSGENAFIRDDFGVSNTSHAADTELGGSSDVSLISGTEADGVSTLRFSIPLDSGDSKDRVLQVGSSYRVIFARGTADDFDSMHNGIGSGTIRIRAN
ncbi:MAG: DOMON domain-containing protein [Candidatus Cloacimonadaceae bacterium]|nr:DOMON domain-containing protein [Candidatus Cloacimonadaceae bacterium]